MSAYIHTHADTHALHRRSHAYAFGSFVQGPPLLQISILRLRATVRNQSGAGVCGGRSGKGKRKEKRGNVSTFWNVAPPGIVGVIRITGIMGVIEIEIIEIIVIMGTTGMIGI